ncbi:MAG: cation:dicarboxylase symporter family transporter [Thermodesulfobacteriota bacterium]
MTTRPPNNPGRLSRALGLLKSFRVNLAAIGVGVLIGISYKELGLKLGPWGNLYLSLLKMTILPIIFSAITQSLGRMLRSGAATRYLPRAVAVFAVATMLAGVLGVASGLIGRPGQALNTSQGHVVLGKLLAEHGDRQSPEASGETKSESLLRRIIPSNVVRAFSEDDSLAVVFLSVLMGMALGINHSRPSTLLLETLQGLYETFSKILNWGLYGLPFGLCCLIANQTASIGVDLLLCLSVIIVQFLSVMLAVGVLYILLIRLCTGIAVGRLVSAMRDPLTLALVAQNSLLAMPMAIERLVKELGQPEDVAEFAVPLAVVLNRLGCVVLFAYVSTFVAQVYYEPLAVYQWGEIALSSGLVGAAAIGNMAVIAPMILSVLAPVGLPASLGIAVMVQTTTLFNPVVALVNLLGACALSTVIARLGRAGAGPAVPAPADRETGIE